MFGPLLTFYTPSVACLVLALVYPMVKSVQTIENPEPQAIAQWQTYWVLFGVITAVEGVLGWVLRYVPLYYILKALLVLWLVAPHTEGAYFLWRSYLRPQLARHAPSLMSRVGASKKMS